MLNLDLIEHHPQRVLEAFRRGEFDQIEIIGQADEKEFFELCFQEKMLADLAKEMPTPRKTEEVPLWFVLAANLSLKLHVENSFLAFERVVRCGGLLGALPPDIASKHLNPQTKEILLECRGFNGKNHYPRQTPCDQDTLRKFAKDVPAQRWMDWFNGPVQRVLQARGFLILRAFLWATAAISLCPTTRLMKARWSCGLMSIITRSSTINSAPRNGKKRTGSVATNW